MATELFDPWVDTKNKLVDAGAQAASWDMQISEDVMAAVRALPRVDREDRFHKADREDSFDLTQRS